jgi:RNA polymerase sigma-70 factor (ECF subfamily)
MTGTTGRPAVPDWLPGLPRKDHPSWSVFIDTHYLPLFGWVLQQIKHSDDARDIVQETFARAYQGGRAYESEAYARNWLYKVASNLIHDRGRHRRRHVRLSLDQLKDYSAVELPDARTPPPDLLLEAAELEHDRSRELAAALRRVPPQYRVILFLRYYMGMKRGEIAQAFGIKEQDVSNRLHRGLERLREYLGAAV